MTHRIRMARKRLMVARERWGSAVRRGKQVLAAERNLRAIERRKGKTA